MSETEKRAFIPCRNTNLDFNNSEKKEIMNKIKAFVKEHTLCDPEWTEAISSQNFLVDLAFVLDMTQDVAFEDLLNIFLSSFSPQFSGGFKLNRRNILIIPDENQKLLSCMMKEDENDSYYKGELRACKITNPETIYQNYLYGIMINIATAANNNSLNNVFEYCIKELLSENSLDIRRGGWIHYRLPWITARILLGLHNILRNNRVIFSDKKLYIDITNQDKLALDSLIERIYDNKYWRSGAGDWVSRWESTGLCLEAFITSQNWLDNKYYVEKISSVIDYLFQEDVMKNWLPSSIDFSSESSTNNLLAQIVLSSVLYRYLKIDVWGKYAVHKKKISDFFKNCINQICNSSNIHPRQYCTVPQILLYVATAIKE